ncbi:hypothetical protein pipiens_010036 [Culex pipiens pipiens]|uniref:C2H2-type domain-containing protein n=1 Tax=Culex pipiens pipiens TaxID=38569 RepID=A0ABD1DBQ4_CULPP
MEYGVNRTFDNHHQVDEYYSNSNDQFVLPPFSMERAQDFGLYYEQESPFVVDTVSDYVPEQQTIYYTGSTGSYPAYSPQQSEGTYTVGPTADSELDQLLQQPYEYQSGAYTMDADMISMFQPQEQKATNYTDNPFGRVFPKDEVLDDLLEEAIKNEDFNVPLPSCQHPKASWRTSRTPLYCPKEQSWSKLFDSVAQDEASTMEVQETQAVIMYIDEHGTLRPYEPTATIAPTPSKPIRKRGRKPLPKAPVTESEFYCLPCNKVFKRHRGLLQHNHYHHSGPKEHQCAQCGKKYPTLERLQAHVQKHNDAFKPYGCSHCTKRFSHPHDMKRHIWTSHGEAPFSCSFCDKRFGRLDHVEQHEISHKNNTVIVKK